MTHANEGTGAQEWTDDEPKITRMNFDAQQGNMEIWATLPNVAMLAAECTELLKANDAKNYVQFDMIPRAELGVQGYRVTVQRLYGKSPAQRVIEMEKEVDTLRTTIATQAARIAELEKQVAWKEGLIRQLTEVDVPAMEADNERLRAELAAVQAKLAEELNQRLLQQYDAKHEWGYPTSLKMWENNPLRQRYKELTGNNWAEPVEEEQEGDA